MKAISRQLQLGDAAYAVDIHGEGDDILARIDDGDAQTLTPPPAGAQRYALKLGDRTWRVTVRRTGSDVEVAVNGDRFVVAPARPKAPGQEADKGGPIRAPMPGKIVELAVVAGDKVARGDKVVVIEAMKLRTSLKAGCDGTISAVQCAQGDQVTGGQVLVEIEEEESDG